MTSHQSTAREAPSQQRKISNQVGSTICLPEPDLLIKILKERLELAIEKASGPLNTETRVKHIRADIDHRQMLGSDCFQRIGVLGDFERETRCAGGALANAMVGVALSYELEHRNKFERMHLSLLGEVFDNGFPAFVDPDATRWPEPLKDTLRVYHQVNQWHNDCIKLARSIAEPVEGDSGELQVNERV